MPAIYNALETNIDGQTLVLEVEQHIGNNWVRCLALGPTEGLRRGVDALDTGGAITVPVGEATLGRLFNALGKTLGPTPYPPSYPPPVLEPNPAASIKV